MDFKGRLNTVTMISDLRSISCLKDFQVFKLKLIEVQGLLITGRDSLSINVRRRKRVKTKIIVEEGMRILKVRIRDIGLLVPPSESNVG